MTVPKIFDHQLRAARRYRQKDDAFLMQQLEERALERVQALTAPPQQIGVLGLSPAFQQALQILFPDSTITTITLDADERLILSQPVDLMIDIGQLSLINDVPGALIQIKQLLTATGVFVSVIYGGDSLPELRAALLSAETELRGGAAARLHPTLSLDGAITLLQRTGFANPVADREPLNLTYDSIAGLVRDLRAAGLGNNLINRQKSAPKHLFHMAETIWRNDAQRLPTTFDIISLTGWQKA